jgi:hypothetical protein
MAKKKKQSDRYIAMWDCLGLEYLGNLTEWEKDKMWSALKEEPATYKIPSLQVLLLRARYNSQRNYEIYIFDAAGLTEQDIKTAFEESPQAMANTIRRIGKQIFSNRLETDNRVIV